MFRKIVPLLVGAAAGLILAFAAIRLLGGEGSGSSSAELLRGRMPELSDWGSIAILLLGLMLLVMVTILLHETGHLLGAAWFGSQVTRLYWGPWIFLFPERRVRFDVRNKFFFGAMQCKIRPYSDDLSFARAIRAQRIVYAAGPAFSLATGLAAWLLAPGLWSWAGGYGVLSLSIGLATLMSDGVNALLLGKRSFALVSAWSMLIQEEQLDDTRRTFLIEASLRHLEELTAKPASPKGRELYDLYLLYDVKLMREQSAQTQPEIALTEEAVAERTRNGKHPKMRRDALDMILGEEIVRLCETGQREEAERLYARIGGREAKLSPLLLKARAYVERSHAAAREYQASAASMQSDAASFGALRKLEEQRLREAGLA